MPSGRRFAGVQPPPRFHSFHTQNSHSGVLTITMGLSTAERNKRKRERKKREREERRKQEEEEAKKNAETAAKPTAEIEVEYVAEPILSENIEGLRKFRELVPLGTSEVEEEEKEKRAVVKVEDDEDDRKAMSKRKLREMLRPSVADLKRKVARPELVEAHDVTATDPEFLIELKSVPGTVPVPRNWGRKRKYLQGKVCTLQAPFAVVLCII